MIGEDGVGHRLSNIAEVIQESRGKKALDHLFPKTKDLNDQIGPVTVFRDYEQAADFLVAEMWFDYVQHMIDNTPFDWRAWNPIVRLMHFHIGVKGRGRADCVGIGSPPQVGPVSPPKKSLRDKMLHPGRI